MLGVARGIASLWAGGYAIPLSFGDGRTWRRRASSRVRRAPRPARAGVPAPVFYFLGVRLARRCCSTRTGFGRHVYAVGGNETAARPLRRQRRPRHVFVFAVPACSPPSPPCCTPRSNQGSHIDGNGYELNAIAAVVIGGTSLAGGVGTVVGSMIGALTLSILDNILGLRNVQSEYQAILKGVIIVLAVVVQRQRRRVSRCRPRSGRARSSDDGERHGAS